MLTDKQPEPVRILTLNGDLTITRVGELKALLVEALEQAETVTVDISAIEDVDVAGLQLLCAANRFAAGRGRSITLVGCGAGVQTLVHTAGLVHGAHCGAGSHPACLWAGRA